MRITTCRIQSFKAVTKSFSFFKYLLSLPASGLDFLSPSHPVLLAPPSLHHLHPLKKKEEKDL